MLILGWRYVILWLLPPVATRVPWSWQIRVGHGLHGSFPYQAVLASQNRGCEGHGFTVPFSQLFLLPRWWAGAGASASLACDSLHGCSLHIAASLLALGLAETAHSTFCPFGKKAFGLDCSHCAGGLAQVVRFCQARESWENNCCFCPKPGHSTSSRVGSRVERHGLNALAA